MRYLSVAAVGVLAMAAFATPAGSRALPRGAADGGAACTVTPIVAQAPIPVVEVMIGAKGPYRFAIDTGAQGDGRISTALADTLGLATIGTVGTPAPGGTVATRPVYGVPQLTVGGMRFDDIGLVAQSTVRGPDAGWDGILGIGLFAKLALTLDYGNRRVMIASTPLTRGVPMRADHGVPTIALTIAAQQWPVHLDTGNGASALFLPEAAATALPLASAPVERGRARTSFGDFAIMEARLAVPVTVGGATLPVTTIGWPAVRPPGNLGSRGLAGMAVTIDQRAAKVLIEPSAAAAPECPVQAAWRGGAGAA